MALGHRLLRITAEDALERQPLASHDIVPAAEVFASADGLAAQPVVLVADARIDNRAELAAALALSSAELALLPDSAVLLRAWLRWGPECLARLAGAFAFAAWEPARQRLVLARDHAGERPLYFRHTPQSLLFATTARALRACPGVSSELDQRQLARDLIGLPPEYPHSRFREIGEIAPGHCLIVHADGTSLTATHRRYWDIHHLAPIRYARDVDYVQHFRVLFDEAVRCRLRTTGNVASELSAGLDSGAVTATAARLAGAAGLALTAYTAVPSAEFAGPLAPGFLADEGPAAAEVAALYPNLRHVRIGSDGSDMLRELRRLFPLLDLPHAAGLNAVWSNAIYDHARASGVNVMLSGALGNFAVSYNGADILRSLFRSGRWAASLRTALHLRRIGISSGRDAASLTVFSALPWPLRRRLDPLIRGTGIAWSALRADRARQFHALDQFRRYLFTHASTLPRLMESQFQNNQYGDYNAAASAGWHIDVRDPTADRRVFEFCASIPPEQFLVGGVSRSLVRRAMQGSLPAATLNRTDKGAQAADWFHSLTRIRGELAAEVERIAACRAARELVDVDLLRDALVHWPATVREAAAKAGILQSAIPRGIAAGYFIRRIERESGATSPAE